MTDVSRETLTTSQKHDAYLGFRYASRKAQHKLRLSSVTLDEHGGLFFSINSFEARSFQITIPRIFDKGWRPAIDNPVVAGHEAGDAATKWASTIPEPGTIKPAADPDIKSWEAAMTAAPKKELADATTQAPE